MEAISFRCTGCEQKLKIGADRGGRKVRCPRCGSALTVPTAATPPAAGPGERPARQQGKAHSQPPGTRKDSVYHVAGEAQAKPATPRRREAHQPPVEAKRANAIREPKKILPQGPDESVAEYDDKEPDDSIAKYDDTEEETPRKKRGRARQRAGGTMADWRKVRLGIRLLFGGLGVFVGLLILVLAFLVLILVNPGKLLQLSWGKLIGLPLCFLFGYQSLIFAGSGFLLFAPVRHGAKRLARVFFGVTAVTWALSLLALVFIMLPLMKAVSDVQQSVDQNAKNVDESLKILQANRPGARLTPEQEARMKEAARKLEAQADEWRKRVEESRRKLEEDMKKAQPSPPPTSQGARFVGTIVAISVVALLYLASVLLVCLQPFLFRALARNLRADELNESCLEFMKLSLSAVCFSTLLRAVLSTLSGTLGAVSFLATMVDWVLILVNLSLFVWYYRLLFRLHGAIGDHLGGR